MNRNRPILRIRQIEFVDVPSLVEYRLLYLAELLGTEYAEEKAGLKKDLEMYFLEALKENRCFGFMAENEKEILSFGVMIIKEIPVDFKRSTYLEMVLNANNFSH